MSKLEMYQLKSKLTDQQLADNIGISRMALYKIKKFKSPKTTLETCVLIFKETGLRPDQYLEGLAGLKKIYTKKS